MHNQRAMHWCLASALHDRLLGFACSGNATLAGGGGGGSRASTALIASVVSVVFVVILLSAAGRAHASPLYCRPVSASPLCKHAAGLIVHAC
jgi:hypothetical protein